MKSLWQNLDVKTQVEPDSSSKKLNSHASTTESVLNLFVFKDGCSNSEAQEYENKYENNGLTLCPWFHMTLWQ